MVENSEMRNAPTSEQVQAAIHNIEVCKEELLSERGAYMQRCRQIREGIAATYDTAKSQRINVKALRAKVKQRKLERDHAEVRNRLEADEQNQLDLMTHLLGDLANTPLGQAAVARAKSEALDELHPEHATPHMKH
jgi:uncharacterized protein (UPF0335 family)